MSHSKANHDTKEDLLHKIAALANVVKFHQGTYSICDGKLKWHVGTDSQLVIPDEFLTEAQIWAAKVRKTADLIDDVSSAWEIMKIPTELNKIDWREGQTL